MLNSCDFCEVFDPSTLLLQHGEDVDWRTVDSGSISGTSSFIQVGDESEGDRQSLPPGSSLASWDKLSAALGDPSDEQSLGGVSRADSEVIY